MKIAIVDYQNVKYNGVTLEYQGLGGSETSNIRLAEEFVKLGHEVDVYCMTPCPIVWQGVSYYNQIQDKEYDVILHSRGWGDKFKGKYNFLMNHDYKPKYGNDAHILLANRKIDKLFVVSKFHKNSFLEMNPNLTEKNITIFRMGVKRDYFAPLPYEQRKNKIVYTSTPYRGLEHLKTIFPKIRKAIPDCELHLYGGFNVYGETYKMEKQELYDEFRKIDGCVVHSNLSQKELAKELCESKLFLYPCTFPETGCIALKEAMTAGLPCITTPQEAISELLKNNEGGYTCSIEAMADLAIELLKDEKKWKQFSNYNLQYNFDWSNVGKEMINFFEHQENEKESVLIGQIVREKTEELIPNAKGLYMPQGCRCDFVSIAGKNYDDGREEIMDVANGKNKDNRKYDYVFFIDDDVFVPKNALIQLIFDMKEKDAGIVGCWYSKKHQPIEFAGIIFDELGVETTLNSPEKKLYKASLVPTGAMLIDMKKARTLGKPYFELKFKECGEDTFFCQKMMAGGYGVYVNGGLIAIHKNLKTNDEFYFGEINKENYCHS